MALKLFFGPNSCAFAAMIALEQAGASYQPLRLDMAAGDQRSPEFKAINPLGRVPVLMVGERAVTESVAVLTYIAHCFPHAGLLPHDDPFATARVYELLSWFSTNIHVHVAQILRSERFTDDNDAQQALKVDGRPRFVEHLDRLNALCSPDRKYLVGDRFGLADAFSLVIWRWAEKLGVDTSPMTRWAEKCRDDFTLAQVQRALEMESTAPRWNSKIEANA